MNDRRSVATDALDTLGTAPIPDDSGRDAIHLAVEPVVAGTYLNPGQHVELRGGKAYAARAPIFSVGIVDPFVEGMVKPRQRFWLVLKPRTITSLRHVWSHPAFPEEGPKPPPPPAPDPVEATPEQIEASERWIRDWVARPGYDGPRYETLIRAASGEEPGSDWDYGREWVKDDEYLHFNGTDAHGEIPPEFWDHLEVVTGKRFGPDERPEYFSCSC